MIIIWCMQTSFALSHLTPASNTKHHAIAATSPKQTHGMVEHELPAQAGLALRSQHLLNGQKKVQILHHDQVYVLQTTRQGKLILTK